MSVDAFILGFAKCGTTFLSELLKQSAAGVTLGRSKEPDILRLTPTSELNSAYKKHFGLDVKRLLKIDCNPINAEAEYFVDIPEKIYRLNPNAKLIFLIREPIARTRSVFVQALSTGHQFERKYYNRRMSVNICAALATYPALRSGFFNRNIERFRNYFPPGQILILDSAQLFQEPIGCLDIIAKFLDLSKECSIQNLGLELNKNSHENLLQLSRGYWALEKLRLSRIKGLEKICGQVFPRVPFTREYIASIEASLATLPDIKTMVREYNSLVLEI